MKRHCHLRFPMVFSSLTQFIWNLRRTNFPNRCRLPCRPPLGTLPGTDVYIYRAETVKDEAGTDLSVWVDVDSRFVDEDGFARTNAKKSAHPKQRRLCALASSQESREQVRGNVLINGLRTLPTKIT